MTLFEGQKTVSSGGTAEAIASSTEVSRVNIQALSGNSGAVYVGGSGVVNGASTQEGLRLTAGEATGWFPAKNLSDVYVDADTNDDGVGYMAVKE